MNARQKAKRLKKEVEIYKRLALRPSFSLNIPPHIETIRIKYPIHRNMFPDDLKASYIEETEKHIGRELGKYLYDNGWINMRTDFNDMMNADVITAWIRIVVDNYDD